MKLSGDKFNLPNMISYLRIILIPFIIYFLKMKSVEYLIYSLVLFMFASFTDLVDGWIARKLKQESEFGRFIDPIADKFLVIASLFAIITIDPYFEILDYWMIIIIAGRDILITVMRILAIKKEKQLQTSNFGKFKTAFQMLSIVIIIMIYMSKRSGFFVTHESVPYYIMLAVTLMTAFSGVRYIITNWQLFFPEKKSYKKSYMDEK
ncbi:MAG: CDP-diacylglycerol--glycerol-3-phosphate 3-phosphatidyltransferase [Spirochaetes bacterium]|nr:CDP-diacylglycerol--glycerol-3-phosphate 3-phosphatidyltransferase [Spirochaetota bacterium]